MVKSHIVETLHQKCFGHIIYQNITSLKSYVPMETLGWFLMRLVAILPHDQLLNSFDFLLFCYFWHFATIDFVKCDATTLSHIKLTSYFDLNK